jgi:hypothetical protein
MTKLDHERLSRSRRGYEWDRNHSKYAIDQGKGRIGFGWRRLGFGKYAEMTLPQLILSDISYYYWLCDNAISNATLCDQATRVTTLAAHILPPVEKRDHKFLVKIRGGKLRSVKLRTSPRRVAGVFVTPHLDLAIINDCKSGERSAAQKLLSWFIRRYFGSSNDVLTARQCETFFNNECNFAVRCRRSHRIR